MATERWLKGPIEGIAPVLQPAAHALLQAADDVAQFAPFVPADVLWAERPGVATAGFHLIHLAGALDRIYTYARGVALNDEQRAALKAESSPRRDLDGPGLVAIVTRQINLAIAELRETDPDTVFETRPVGRQALPATVIGLLFHGAEHATRHVGQFITTVRMAESHVRS
jgi:hypothetical protein